MFFFFNDTATTEIYTLSLHDALPISSPGLRLAAAAAPRPACAAATSSHRVRDPRHHPSSPSSLSPLRGQRPLRSEEHTSELQSRQYLVCRLLLEKKNNSL